MKSEYLQIRISKSNKEKLEELCKIEGCTKSEWIRNMILLEHCLLERRRKKD